MSAFAVVNDFETLHSACDAISELLGTYPDQADTTLLGIWVESVMAADVNALLMGQEASASARLSADIQSTCGINGHWTLCWLSGRKTERTQLVQVLLGVRPAGDRASRSARCFIPFFDCAMPQSEVQAEVGWLRGIHGAHVLAPSCQDRPTGRLWLAPVYGRGPSAVQ